MSSPRNVAIAVAMGVVFAISAASCGSDSSKKVDNNTTTPTAVPTTGTTTYVWATDVAPIVKASCSDANCHGKVQALGIVYEDNAANFKASTTMKSRLNLDMPQGKRPMDATKLQILLDFFAQK